MRTFLNILRVIADLVIVVAVVVFVDSVIGYASTGDASSAAGLIVFSFVVKGWIRQYLSKDDEKVESAESEEGVTSGSAVMLAVGAILIFSIGFGAMNEAGDAMDDASDAMDTAEDIEYRVDDLESRVEDLEY